MGLQSFGAQGLNASPMPSRITATAWMPNRDLNLPEWSAIGRRFGMIVRCSQWWLGDWIRYGNAKFGERYVRAAAITGYDVQSLMNMVHVASRFDVYRRRENLSWSHHAALTAWATDEQEKWLDRAVAEKLSVADLRLELKSARRACNASGDDKLRPATLSDEVELKRLICPHCGNEVPVTEIDRSIGAALRDGRPALLVGTREAEERQTR